MEKGQVVLGLLLPTNQAPPKSLHPAMGPLDHPPPRSIPRLAGQRLGLFPPRPHMRRETKLLDQLPRILVVIALIQTQPLWLLGRGLWPLDRNAPERGLDELLVVAVGALDGQAHGKAVGFDQQAALGAQFAAIGGIFSRLFPPQAGPWSWPHPSLTIASRVLSVGHIPPGPGTRVGRTPPRRSIPESGGGPRNARRCRWRRGLPTGNRYVGGKRWHPWPCGRPRAGYGSPADAACAGAGAVQSASKVHRGYASHHPPLEFLDQVAECEAWPSDDLLREERAAVHQLI